ncbi:pseudouridine-5'-phosphatase-like [Cylas formicarius]|uniref:pseudouridine-5'-phosphatase-like n=1 Tax=Cylas formicarius TaxID=197179 RepID=UPI0029584B50|nr:pseudouridine-5'-phosphatase-like [Cylas formicarius]
MLRINVLTKFKKISHIIFDLDGTLLDTESVYRNAIDSIARRHGQKYTSEIVGKVIGRVVQETSRIAVTEMNLPISHDEFEQELRHMSERHFRQHGANLLPGAEPLIRHLHSNKIPIAVATCSSEEHADLKISRHREFFKLFNHFVYGETDPEVIRGKPSPDIFLVCASRFPDNPHPNMCLAFEDAPTGVHAAINAGMQVVMVPDDNLPDHLQKDATLAIKSLHHVPLDKFGLPILKLD